jgi:hypothetical protein
MPWLAAILGAALIGAAVHGLAERSDMDDDGLSRQARQRKAALLAAREVLGDQVSVDDLVTLAEYIRVGVAEES